jgi:hypothetical protein
MKRGRASWAVRSQAEPGNGAVFCVFSRLIRNESISFIQISLFACLLEANFPALPRLPLFIPLLNLRG